MTITKKTVQLDMHFTQAFSRVLAEKKKDLKPTAKNIYICLYLACMEVGQTHQDTGIFLQNYEIGKRVGFDRDKGKGIKYSIYRLEALDLIKVEYPDNIKKPKKYKVAGIHF